MSYIIHITRKKRTFRFKFHSLSEIRNEWAKVRTVKCGPIGDANYLKVSVIPVLWLHACFELGTTWNSNAPPVILPLLDVLWNLPKHSNILELLAPDHFWLDERSSVSKILRRATLNKLKYETYYISSSASPTWTNSFSCKSMTHLNDLKITISVRRT